jgi:uncharacterized protein YuzE
MKTDYDKEANAVYINFEKLKKGQVKETIKLNKEILVDLNENKKIIGIEILNASSCLEKNNLKGLDKIMA